MSYCIFPGDLCCKWLADARATAQDGRLEFSPPSYFVYFEHM